MHNVTILVTQPCTTPAIRKPWTFATNMLVSFYTTPDDALAVAESREAMAEAALALCTTRDEKLTGRITFCTPILEELNRTVRTCDGKTALGSPLEKDAAPHR